MSYTNLLIGGAAFAGLLQLGIVATTPDVGQQRGLSIEHFSYQDGAFTQRVVPSRGAGMPARWAAEINRITGGITVQLCIGSGQGVYKGTTDTYLADEWVGDDCPDLQPGDVAEAAWTWTDENGLTRSVSASLVIE